MKLHYIGHQSWLIENNQTNILFDPILCETLGHTEELPFNIYPLREIDTTQFPKIDAIFLSHEHIDHFHLPSLNFLDKTIPVYIGELMPICVEIALKEIGFVVNRVELFKDIVIGDLNIRLFPSGVGTVYWEQRVTAFYISDVTQKVKPIFIAVDALISDQFSESVENQELEPPVTIIVSNNSQIPPYLGHGAYTNCLPINVEKDYAFPGVRLLNGILVDYLEALPFVKKIILCGDGVLDPFSLYGPYLFSDNKELARIANQLGVLAKAYGLDAGECLDLKKDELSKNTWANKLDSANKNLKQKQSEFIEKPIEKEIKPVLPVIEDDDSLEKTLTDVANELQILARALMLAPVTEQALHMYEYMGKKLGEHKIAFRFLLNEDFDNIVFALNLNNAQFEQIELHEDENILTAIPFGVELYIQDFWALFSGEIQIWDLAGKSMNTWYANNDAYANLLSFLYTYYGEQTRPDLALKIYKKVIKKLKHGECTVH